MRSSLMTVKILDDLHLKLKQQALNEDRRIWELVQEALTKYLNK
jgi:hypothetical protein